MKTKAIADKTDKDVCKWTPAEKDSTILVAGCKPELHAWHSDWIERKTDKGIAGCLKFCPHCGKKIVVIKAKASR